MEHFREINSRIENGEICLLLPEVIKLEIEKNWNPFPGELGRKFAIVEAWLNHAGASDAGPDSLTAAQRTEVLGLTRYAFTA